MLRLLATTLVLSVGCKKEEPTDNRHQSCKDLDNNKIANRLDQVTSDNPDVLDVDGECLEAATLATGEAYSIRFNAPAADGEVPAYHIQLYMLPPEEDGTLSLYAPVHMSTPTCLGVPAGNFCGHLDDNTLDDASDDVDYRGKTGSLALEITDETGDGLYSYEGDFEMVAWAVDENSSPQKYIEPAVAIEGTFHWRHPDGNW